MNEIKIKALVDDIMYETRCTKTSIGEKLGYKSLNSFCQALNNRTMPQRKIEKLLSIYGYNNEFKKTPVNKNTGKY